MIELYILTCFEYDTTYLYGFRTMEQLIDYLKKHYLNDSEIEYYIYCDWFNQDKLNLLKIKVIKND